MRVTVAAIVLAALGTARVTLAQTSTPPPTPPPARAPEEKMLQPPGEAPGSAAGRPDVTLAKPEEPESGSVTKQVRESGVPPDHTRPSANAGAIKDLRLVSLRDGEARVTFLGAPQTLRVGDTIAGDRVQRIEAARIILNRAEGDGHEAAVIVTFDVQGRARVRVFSTQDPHPANIPLQR